MIVDKVLVVAPSTLVTNQNYSYHNHTLPCRKLLTMQRKEYGDHGCHLTRKTSHTKPKGSRCNNEELQHDWLHVYFNLVVNFLQLVGHIRFDTH